MSSLFSYDGPLMRALGEFSNLVILNLVTMLLCIPVVTAGAAITSMHYSIMKMRDGDAHILQQYWEEFKGNLKQVTPVWLINVVAFIAIALDFWITSQSSGVAGNLFAIIFYLVVIVVVGIFVWLYPLMARFVYSTGAALRNAALLAISKLPRTVAMMAFTIIIPVVLVMNLRLYPILFCVGISLPAYLSSFFYYPVIKEMIERKLEEDGPKDPEFDERLMGITPIFRDKPEDEEEE